MNLNYSWYGGTLVARMFPERAVPLFAGSYLFNHYYRSSAFTKLEYESLLIRPSGNLLGHKEKEAYEVADSENRVRAAALSNSPMNCSQQVGRFHWSDVGLIDRAVSNLILECVEEQIELTPLNLSDEYKNTLGVPFTVGQVEGYCLTVWIPNTAFQVLSGLLVSNGLIVRQSSSSMAHFVFGKGASELSLDLVILTAALLEVCQLGNGFISKKETWNATSRTITTSYVCTSMGRPIFASLRALWYARPDNNGSLPASNPDAKERKVLHPKIVGSLKPLAICYAYLCKGRINQDKEMSISHLSFPVKDLVGFSDHVNALMGIKTKADPVPRSPLYIGAADSAKFSDCIAPFTPESGLGKLNLGAAPSPSFDPPVSGDVLVDQINQMWLAGQRSRNL